MARALIIFVMLISLMACGGRPVAAQTLRPALAIGLTGIDDWSVAQPFIDVMKTARPWVGHLPGQWGGWDDAMLRAGRYLDADGWPLAVPKELTGISTLFLTDLPVDDTASAGRYRLTYKGEGDLKLDGLAQNIQIGRGQMSFDFTPGPGQVLLTILSSDPRGKGNYIHDIVVIKEANIAAYEAGQMFNPDWLRQIQGLRALRFMDWMKTNNSVQSEWNSRPLPGDYTYARIGAPVEVMLALANEIGADPWFNIPHLANDAYIRSFAELVKAGMAPGRKAYLEYSNEVWNWQFGQAQWAEAQGEARWGQKNSWVQFYALRATQMADIWRDVFADQAKARLVRVISTQTGWIGLEQDILLAPLWLAQDPLQTAPAGHFDAYAVSGYFGNQLGGDEKAPMVKEWIAQSRAAAAKDAAGLTGDAQTAYIAAHQFDLAVTLASTELRDGSVSGKPDDTVARMIGDILPYQAGVAQAHGLELIMYEGGSHVVGLGAWVDDPDLTAFFTHLNYTPEMAGLYTDLLAGWRAAGGTMFNAFVEVATPGKWGSWGALRHLDDSNPRWDVLMAYNRAGAWWDTP